MTKSVTDKKHSENADTLHVYDLDLWPWSYFKVQKAYVIRCRLLHCALVPGMMSVCNSLRDMTINSFFVTFDLHRWPSAYAKVTSTLFSRCTLYSCTLVPRMKFVGLTEFEIWTIVCWKLKWRHNDVITYSNLIKFKYKSTKGISKRHIKFHFDRTS